MRYIHPRVLLLSIVSFLNDVSSGMIKPILPLFVTSLGGAGMAVGLFGGLRKCLGMASSFIWGYLSDELGKRKVFVVAGYTISDFFKFLLSFAHTWPMVIVFGSLERVGKSVRRAPRDAMIATAMPDDKGRGFGFHRTLDKAGTVVGALLVALLLATLHLSFNRIIFIAALVSVLAIIPLIFLKDSELHPVGEKFSFHFKEFPRDLRFFILIRGIFAWANLSYMFFVLEAQEAFSDSSIIIPILLYAWYSFCYSLFSLPIGMIADKIGRQVILLIGYLLFGGVCLGFIFFESFSMYIVLFACYGLALAILKVQQRVYATDLSPRHLEPMALGMFFTLSGLVALPANILAGLLWQSVSPAATFGLSAALSFICAFLLIVMKVVQLKR